MNPPINLRAWLLTLIILALLTQAFSYYSFYQNAALYPETEKIYYYLDLGLYVCFATSFLVGLVQSFYSLKDNRFLRIGLLYTLFTSVYFVLNLYWYLFDPIYLGPNFAEDPVTNKRLDVLYQLLSFWAILCAARVYLLLHDFHPQKTVRQKSLILSDRVRNLRAVSGIIDLYFSFAIGGYILLIGFEHVLYFTYNDASEWAIYFLCLIGSIGTGMIIYFFSFEYLFGNTIGQAVVGHQLHFVKNSDRSFQRTLKRSCYRVIPLEFLSVFSSISWHEKQSDTRTLPRNFELTASHWSINPDILDEGILQEE